MAVEVIREIAALRSRLRGAAGSIGLVPTMGNLHAGHLALVRAAKADCDVTVATIFVNPTQFVPGEDFDSYPRTLEADVGALGGAGIGLVFAPATEEVYPRGREGLTTVSVPSLSNTLCGLARPGHFDGVATVVAKLLNIAGADRAYFGEKDWQQLALIRAMAADLDIPTEIVGVATVRADDGLALSSRNQYLTAAERAVAPELHRTLGAMREAIAAGDDDYASLEADGRRRLVGSGFDVDYVAVRDALRLVEPDAGTRELRILAAAHLGRARLIDNVGLVRPSGQAQ